jgi:hypothetical protein
MARGIATSKAAITFIAKHGVVMERAKGDLPSLVEAIVGGPIRGSWWAHPDGRRIFKLLNAVHDSPDVLRCRLVSDKITYAHRRVWPALVALADGIGHRRLARLAQEHTASGAHRTVTTPFPAWVPADVLQKAMGLSSDDARTMLAPFVV